MAHTELSDRLQSVLFEYLEGGTSKEDLLEALTNSTVTVSRIKERVYECDREVLRIYATINAILRFNFFENETESYQFVLPTPKLIAKLAQSSEHRAAIYSQKKKHLIQAECLRWGLREENNKYIWGDSEEIPPTVLIRILSFYPE